MFDFAISQHQKHPPTRRMLMSGIVSCAIHVAAVLTLIAYPELLLGGVSHWFRPPVITGLAEEREWRTVTFIGTPGMQSPSAATLKKYVFDFEAAAAAAAAAGKNPPISVRWGNESEETQKAEAKATPLRPVPGNEEPAPEPQSPQVAGVPQGMQPGEAGGGGDQGSATGRTVYLPAPAPAPPRPEPPRTADAGTAPKSIPNSIQPPPPAPAPAPAKPAQEQASQAPVQVFEDEQKAIRSEGSGFFNTKGFPLGDYASAIIERIKGNWMIPSNLRNSQGRTTVVFFIGKDGRYTNAHIVTSSGSTSLDLAALNAVLVSNPFPPLPTGFPGEQVGAKFVFSYNERQ